MRSDKHVFMAGMAGVVVGAVLVVMLPAVAAVVGDPLALGDVNSIDDRTDLKGKAKGANLQIKNTGNAAALSAKADRNAIKAKATSGPVAVNAKASRNAVKVKVDDGQSPIKVNPSAGTAINLSADQLDGFDSSDFLQASGLVAIHTGGDQSEEVTAVNEVVRSVALIAPEDGVVIVNSTANAGEEMQGDGVWCSISEFAGLSPAFTQRWESAGSLVAGTGQLAGTRGFDVAAGEKLTVNLVCVHVGVSGSSFVNDSALTATFIPTP
jgi:hypothetical protein